MEVSAGTGNNAKGASRLLASAASMRNSHALALLAVVTFLMLVVVPLGSASSNSTANATTTAAPYFSLMNEYSSSPAAQGQSEQLTIAVSGGAAPYSYTFLLTNALTGNIVFWSTAASLTPSSSVSFALPVEANDIGALVFSASADDAAGLSAFGSNMLFVSSAVTSTATSSSTTSTSTTSISTSTVATTSSTTIMPILNYTLAYTGSIGTAIGASSGGNIRFIAPKSTAKAITINLTAASLIVGLTVSDSSQIPSFLPAFGKPYYKYIQINGSVGGVDVDNYVSNATYNFSVPISVVQNNGFGKDGVVLYKYFPSSGSWDPLPTRFLGSNSTSYFYSAVSSSLSIYVVGFGTSTSYTTGASTASSISLGTAYNSFFFAVAGIGLLAGSGTSFTTNFVKITSNIITKTGGSSASDAANVVAIGYNSFQIGSTVPYSGNIALPTGYTDYNTVWAGISANVIFNNNDVVAKTSSTSATNTLSFSVNFANSVVLLFYAASGNQITSVTIPTSHGCTAATIKSTGTNGLASAAVANCIAQGTGTYATNFFVPRTGGTAMSVAALVFPPYNVILKDTVLNNSTTPLSVKG